MILGMTTSTFTLVHVLISLVGIASGLVVVFGLLTGKRLDGWTALFLATTVATSVTGFAFPFDHPLRSKVDNNWFITDKKVGSEFFTKDQRQMVKDIFHDLHSPEYADTVYRQVEHDSGKEGFGTCAIALFGNPGSGQFEFVLTGRHCTRRCESD